MPSEIEQNFGLIWPHHVSNLTQLLIAARQSFGGDLDMFLVLAVIGERTFSAQSADPALTFTIWQDRGTAAATPRDINARAIADYTGIPRETVRRKLGETEHERERLGRKLMMLEEKGWIVRNGDGVLQATAVARRDLDPLTRASLRYLEQLFTLFKSVSGR